MSYLTGQGTVVRRVPQEILEESCGHFALAMDDLLRTGRVGRVRLAGEITAGSVGRATGGGRPFVRIADSQALRNALPNDGQTGILFIRNGVERAGNRYSQYGTGHFFNVQNRRGQLYIFDAQYGEIFDRPIDIWSQIGPSVQLADDAPKNTQLLVDLLITGGAR